MLLKKSRITYCLFCAFFMFVHSVCAEQLIREAQIETGVDGVCTVIIKDSSSYPSRIAGFFGKDAIDYRTFSTSCFTSVTSNSRLLEYLKEISNIVLFTSSDQEANSICFAIKGVGSSVIRDDIGSLHCVQ